MKFNFRIFFWSIAALVLILTLCQMFISFRLDELYSNSNVISYIMMGVTNSAQFIFYGEIIHLITKKLSKEKQGADEV
ncbi:hypothetical protein [Mechercharimyces sp. CAU 1602]|uniref:hypothetical protein n=1 Tax=Mechercharimyces sp. CAU 1602 TaxID=2973933 RepID=UPI0021627BF7|nr:hypothetical protein [Mechercharimyces sp. CAU 1602]MCS1351135.1 hypothetical protein [Mechercharimyces sp. CAU 1602]